MKPTRAYRVWTKDSDGGYTIMTGWMSRIGCKRMIIGRWGHWPPFAHISKAKSQEDFIHYNRGWREDDVMYCDMCGDDRVKDDEATHLNLYVNGSEGIAVCLRCRGILTELVRGIQSIKNSAVLRAMRSNGGS